MGPRDTRHSPDQYGRGNAALVIMPDGTTLLIDAGDATAPFAEPRPNSSRSPAAWISDYIDSVLPSSSQRRLDYALITHFHADHMGAIAELSSLIPIRKIVDRGWPDYSYPAPLADTLVRNYRGFLKQRTTDHSLIVERIRVGRADQLVPVPFRLPINGVCKLQIQRCRHSQDCHRCQGALP